MAAQQPDEELPGQVLPAGTVTALMTLNPDANVGGLRIARFTQAAKDAILSHLPEGAEYGEGGDHETFRWTIDGVVHDPFVVIDEDRLVAAGIDWQADSPPETLAQYVIVTRDPGPTTEDDENALIQAMNLALQDIAPADNPGVIDVSGGRRRRRKTRKTKGGKKRKTLRRRK